jgi:hypothetical protein
VPKPNRLRSPANQLTRQHSCSAGDAEDSGQRGTRQNQIVHSEIGQLNSTRFRGLGTGVLNGSAACFTLAACNATSGNVQRRTLSNETGSETRSRSTRNLSTLLIRRRTRGVRSATYREGTGSAGPPRPSSMSADTHGAVSKPAGVQTPRPGARTARPKRRETAPVRAQPPRSPARRRRRPPARPTHGRPARCASFRAFAAVTPHHGCDLLAGKALVHVEIQYSPPFSVSPSVAARINSASSRRWAASSAEGPWEGRSANTRSSVCRMPARRVDRLTASFQATRNRQGRSADGSSGPPSPATAAINPSCTASAASPSRKTERHSV